MKMRVTGLLFAVCLLLTACAPEAPDATESAKPAMLVATITTTHPNGSAEKMEQVYDENGHMVKAKHYAGDKLVVSYNVTCDSEGRVLKMSDDLFGTGISMEYTYIAGRTEKIETKLNGVTFFTQRYTYHENGEKATYMEADLRSSSTTQYKYIYEEGVMRWEEYYENGILLFSWEYAYDAEGRRVEGTKRDGDFTPSGSRIYTYEDKITTAVTYNAEGAVQNTKTVHYGDDGSVTKETFTEKEETTVTEYTYLQKN